MRLVSHDGMVMFPVYYADGTRGDELESIEITESYEKRTIDESSAKWFPSIRVEQRCKLQKIRGMTPLEMKPYGDPFEAWILLENESVALPFVGTHADPPPA